MKTAQRPGSSPRLLVIGTDKRQTNVASHKEFAPPTKGNMPTMVAGGWSTRPFMQLYEGRARDESDADALQSSPEEVHGRPTTTKLSARTIREARPQDPRHVFCSRSEDGREQGWRGNIPSARHHPAAEALPADDQASARCVQEVDEGSVQMSPRDNLRTGFGGRREHPCRAESACRRRRCSASCCWADHAVVLRALSLGLAASSAS